jgi:predicted ABC-type transport system involved in lysophospholipase L1 biosynthesis ATPase subunit
MRLRHEILVGQPAVTHDEKILGRLDHIYRMVDGRLTDQNLVP